MLHHWNIGHSTGPACLFLPWWGYGGYPAHLAGRGRMGTLLSWTGGGGGEAEQVSYLPGWEWGVGTFTIPNWQGLGWVPFLPGWGKGQGGTLPIWPSGDKACALSTWQGDEVRWVPYLPGWGLPSPPPWTECQMPVKTLLSLEQRISSVITDCLKILEGQVLLTLSIDRMHGNRFVSFLAAQFDHQTLSFWSHSAHKFSNIFR